MSRHKIYRASSAPERLTQINSHFRGHELLRRTAAIRRDPTGKNLMFRMSFCLKAAFLAVALSSAAIAQTRAASPATKPLPAASTGSSGASMSTQVENWTEAQWEAAKKEWAKDTTKWANCQRQWNKHKDEGRKSWPSLYKCMTN
jgi:hypothetical protein